MQEEDPIHHFNTLGLPTTATWEEVKRSYRQLIRRWHPDRAASDGVSHRIAEERSKEITIAYKALSNYHRAHGSLPRPVPAAVTEPAPAPAPAARVRDNAAEHSSRPAAAPHHRPAPGRDLRWLYAALVISVAVILMFMLDPWSDTATAPPAISGVSSPAGTTTAENPDDTGVEKEGEISIGSTLGDVYAIQGVPTLTAGNTWHYGKSRIHFKGGRVESWEEHPDNPLRIAANGKRTESKPLTFGIGSSREDVLRLQGPPLRESDSVWEYGASRIYFRGDMVVKWQESPLNPLHVKR